MKNLKIIIPICILFLGITAVSSHGVDVTADTMVIANESNGQLIKDLADSNSINISVYKFTSADEVAHILEHNINNTNKKILIVAYQDIGNEFLKNNPELSQRIIVVNDVNNASITKGLNDIKNKQTETIENEFNFTFPLTIGIIIGLIIGLGCGILIMKKKK